MALPAVARTLALAVSLQAEPPEDPAALRRACDAQDMEACSKLAFKLLKGDGVPADASAAARLYRKACDSGYGLSCDMLGSLRARAPEAAQALRDYEAGCQAGKGRDCVRLGSTLGSEDPKGADAYLKACELGVG